MHSEKSQVLSDEQLENVAGGKLDRRFFSSALASVSILGVNLGISAHAMDLSDSSSAVIRTIDAGKANNEYKNEINENEELLKKRDTDVNTRANLKTFFKNLVIDQFNAYKEFYLYALSQRGVEVLKDDQSYYYLDSKGAKKRILDYGKDDKNLFTPGFSKTAGDIVAYYYHNGCSINTFEEVRGTYAKQYAECAMMYPLEYKSFCEKKNIEFRFFGKFSANYYSVLNAKNVFKSYTNEQRRELLKISLDYTSKIIKKHREEYKHKILDKLDELVGKDGHEGIFINYQDPFNLKVNTDYNYYTILDNAIKSEKQAIKLYKEVSGFDIDKIENDDVETIWDLYVKTVNSSYYMKESNYFYRLMLDYISKKPLKYS